MNWTWIVPFLSLGTLIAVLVFVLYGKAAIDARRARKATPKSTLAKDGPDGGLPPLEQ
jgi:hypothetical protein